MPEEAGNKNMRQIKMEQGQVRRKAAGTSRIRKQRIRRRTADKRAGQIEGREQEI